MWANDIHRYVQGTRKYMGAHGAWHAKQALRQARDKKKSREEGTRVCGARSQNVEVLQLQNATV